MARKPGPFSLKPKLTLLLCSLTGNLAKFSLLYIAQFKSPVDPISSKPLTICSFCILDCYNLLVIMEESTKLFKLCSLLMAFLFAYSASVQFNDPDWYLWFPLYASACVVNLLVHNIFTTCKTIAKVAFWLGVFLFVKVVIEDYVNELAGFWSLNLEQRVVREKIGSGLVVISMLLHLEALAIKSNKGYVQYGMALLVAFSYGLPFYFSQVSFK